MKNMKIICMLIVSIMVGASAVASVSASEIDNGSLDVTINDGLWGTVSPVINIPDQTGVTLEAIKINETNYEVRDNLSIPLTITCDKANVLTPKKVFTVVRAGRGLNGALIKSAELVPISNGTILYDGIVPDSITANARYNISGETFTNGETLKLTVIAIGAWIPGKGSPNQFEYTLAELLDMMIPEENQGVIIRILKEFVNIGIDIDLSSFPIFAGKTVDLNIDYVLGGEEEPPEGYTLDVDVAEGNGSITISPDQDLYDDGAVVKLTAVPKAGYIFSEWSGDVSGTDNPINVTMDENKTISAHFIEAPVKVNAKSFGLGSATLTVVNQRDYELSAIEYNLTMKGGVLGLISKQVNGTIGNISADGSITLKTPSVWFGLGKSTITLELIIPGEGVIEKTFSATHIGPIILVK